MDVGRKSGTSNSIPLSFGALILQTGWGGAGLVMLVFVVSISGTYPIKLIEQIVDSAVNANSRSDILPILTGGALYILTFVIWSGAQYLLNTMYRRIEAEAGHRLRSRLFSHVLHLRPEFFSAYQTGDVTADVLKDSEITTSQFLKPVLFIAQSVTKFTFGFIFMLSIDWRMTLFVFPIGIFSAFLARNTTARVKVLTTDSRNSTTTMWGIFSETIRGVREIRANMAESAIHRKLDGASEQVAAATIREVRFNEGADAINSLFYMTVIGLIMTFGAVLVIWGHLTVGGLAAFMMYNGMLTDPVMQSVDFYREILRTRISIERLNRLFLNPRYPIQNTSPVARLEPTIRLEGVTFQYPSGPPVLHDVSLEIASGSCVAVVGGSGSGKTTLSQVISGILQPERGIVSIGGCFVNDKTLDLIRKNLTIVFQDPFLFNASFKDNILLGMPDATSEAVARAIRLSCLGPVIDSSAHGIDTLVGENGNKLSSGERQRVGLARGFLRQCSVYLLDEATSSLDSTTSRQIVSNVRDNFKNSTVIIIAHKIASIQDMDRIIVMKKGRIVADGNHQKLLDSSTEYQRLYRDQFSASD